MFLMFVRLLAGGSFVAKGLYLYLSTRTNCCGLTDKLNDGAKRNLLIDTSPGRYKKAQNAGP
jgi:hypothetical protein